MCLMSILTKISIKKGKEKDMICCNMFLLPSLVEAFASDTIVVFGFYMNTSHSSPPNALL
jgi:hypothetical protein